MPGVKKTPQKTPHVNRKGGGGGDLVILHYKKRKCS